MNKAQGIKGGVCYIRRGGGTGLSPAVLAIAPVVRHRPHTHVGAMPQAPLRTWSTSIPQHAPLSEHQHHPFSPPPIYTPTSAYMGAPRATACSHSSNTNTPAPSPITKPSLALSKGREAWAGESLEPGTGVAAGGRLRSKAQYRVVLVEIMVLR